MEKLCFYGNNYGTKKKKLWYYTENYGTLTNYGKTMILRKKTMKLWKKTMEV